MTRSVVLERFRRLIEWALADLPHQSILYQYQHACSSRRRRFFRRTFATTWKCQERMYRRVQSLWKQCMENDPSSSQSLTMCIDIWDRMIESWNSILSSARIPEKYWRECIRHVQTRSDLSTSQHSYLIGLWTLFLDLSSK